LSRAAFGRAVQAPGHWFQLGPDELFFLCHALKCLTVQSVDRKQMDEGQLWDHLTSSTSQPFPEMFRAYQHLRFKRSGLQYGADFVAYRHHPALVHSEFAVVVVPEGHVFGARCGRMKVWPDLLCVLRASGSVAKTLLLLTITSSTSDLTSPDCLQQLIVHERTIARWMPQQCREQQPHKPSREEEAQSCREQATMVEQQYTRDSLVSNYWGLIPGFTVLSSLQAEVLAELVLVFYVRVLNSPIYIIAIL
jgi:tRNA-splicing endonuclease subunit Sen2